MSYSELEEFAIQDTWFSSEFVWVVLNMALVVGVKKEEVSHEQN